MTEKVKPDTAEGQPWTREDEENLLLEISEDRRMARLGIDPDGNPLQILLQLRRKMHEIERR
jgi:hypothetical protein